MPAGRIRLLGWHNNNISYGLMEINPGCAVRFPSPLLLCGFVATIPVIDGLVGYVKIFENHPKKIAMPASYAWLENPINH